MDSPRPETVSMLAVAELRYPCEEHAAGVHRIADRYRGGDAAL